MSMKEPSGKMRLKMFEEFLRTRTSNSTADRITMTFTKLSPNDHEGREKLAAQWCEKLKPCQNDSDVQGMLVEMGL